VFCASSANGGFVENLSSCYKHAELNAIAIAIANAIVK
jgi:hypothetical protein